MTAPFDHRRLYDRAINALLPECKDEDERDARARLLLARDVGTRNVATLSGQAQRINLLIVELAGAFAFASVTTECLQLAIEQCRRLMACSAGAMQLERDE